jgi:two-component system osmolarity sensor histidine kinase EnvZ
MVFNWLKKYMPRGIYARGALILLVPVVVIQLVVIVAFSQRYFEDITRQLSRGVVAEIGLYVETVEGIPADQVPVALQHLDTRLDFKTSVGSDTAVEDRRRWYDFSSRVIASELRSRIDGVEGVDVASDTRIVRTSILTDGGRLTIELPRSRASASNPHQLMVWTAFTGLVMTLIAFIFLRNQLRPIRQLARVAESFGRGESKPYRPAGAAEVRAAGAAFLNMRSRIERQIEQRTLMLSGVSHDLRTPLTRIRLGLSMLDVPEEDAEEIAAMQADLDEMEQLINTFLDFARSEATETPEQVDLVELVRSAKERAERAGGEVKLGAMPEAPVMLNLRPAALSRALDNLMSNARRYGTTAQLSLTEFDRAVVISVEDNGPGIAPDVRERALQPFVRLDTARNQNRGSSGVGLGLAIAHDVARRHGGTLRLGESEDLGGLKADIVLARQA